MTDTTPKEPTTLERLQHFKIEQLPALGDMYLAELLGNAETELADAEQVIDKLVECGVCSECEATVERHRVIEDKS